ncbi:nuclear distribution protein PAC1 [Cryptococcus tetragattii IND107]|uniref:Nuclear distribution protein PAC1 n=1 Tax=Cryptococcus tetragattii IND107 TaxID=1296105 RepID=A0ABR3C7B6_9TREE
MPALSDRQKDELHRAMLSYLHAAGMHAAYAALLHDAAIADFDPADPSARAVGLLEKKWTSVIRLQKKIIDLEARNAALLAELASPARPSASAPFVPRPPPRHTLASHRAPVTRLAFHPTWTVLASASEDATVKVWDWEAGEMERTLKGHTKAVMDVDFDRKGSLMASRDKTIRVWQVSSGYVSGLVPLTNPTSYCTKTFTGHAEWVREAVPSEDGRWLVSASNDQTSRVWDFSTGETKMQLRGHEHVVECALFAPVNAYPAIRELAGLKPPAANDTRAKSPGVYVATGSRDKTIKLWDALSGQCLRTFVGHDNWIRALVFHPTGKYLLSASDDKTIKLWDLVNGRCTKTIEAHSHFVTCMTWARAVTGGNKEMPNGDGSARKEARRINVLATGSVDQTIKVWTP